MLCGRPEDSPPWCDTPSLTDLTFLPEEAQGQFWLSDGGCRKPLHRSQLFARSLAWCALVFFKPFYLLWHYNQALRTAASSWSSSYLLLGQITETP